MRDRIIAFVFPISVSLLAVGHAFAAPVSASADTTFSSGAFDQAMPLYQAMSRNDPKDTRAPVRLGELELYADRLPDAKRDFEAVLTLDANNKAAKNGLKDIADRTGANGTYQIDDSTRATSVPFVATDPLPIIKVRINNQRDAYFLIDTGAPGVVIDLETAKALHLDVKSAGQGVFAGGQQAAVMQSAVDAIALGDVVVRHVPVAVLPMAGAPAPPGIHLDGMVGTSVFYHFLTTLDYVHGRLILAPRSDSAGFEQVAKQRGNSIVPMWYVPDHFLFAQAKVNGVQALFNIDTGGDDVGVQVSKGLLKNAHIKLDESHKSRMAGPGGEVTMIPFKASVAVGDTTIKDVPGVYTPDGDQYGIFPFAVGGTISHKFFRAQVVTFDFAAMKMIIAKS